MEIREQIAELLGQLGVEIPREQLVKSLEVPPNPDMGDYAFPCFLLAKERRMAPMKIAQELADACQTQNHAILKRAEAVGPYINFFLSTSYLAEAVLPRIEEEQERYGSTEQGKGKRVCVDFSSTNIAKPFHIGHIRSTVQGDALSNLYAYLGFDVVRINYLGDYGTQFGMLIEAYEMWGDEKKLEEEPIQTLLDLYVRYNRLVKEDEQWADKARARFSALEKGEEKELELWRRFKELSLREFKRVYTLLDIDFDSWDGEFYHAQFIPEVLALLKEKQLLVEDDGAQVVKLGEDEPPALILKSNGASTYITRDLATAFHRKKIYDFAENIYVVATQQNLHFQQLKKVLQKMGVDWADQIAHVPFGMVSLEEGTLSTRLGKVVFLEDVLQKSVEKTRSIMEERNPDLVDKERVAHQVGIGAIKFQELYNNRIKDYTFSWENLLSFEGESGPYVQYCAARAARVLQRAGIDLKKGPRTSKGDFSKLGEKEEHQLLFALQRFPQTLQNAFLKKEPSMIAREAVEISKRFNRFYAQCPILAGDEALQRARCQLVWSTRIVLTVALKLLGIQAPEQM